MSRRIEATHFDGEVLITVDPATARRLAGAWAADHTTGATDVSDGAWVHDVIALCVAAAQADAQNGHAPRPVLVSKGVPA